MPSRKNRLSSINKARIFAATIGSNARAVPHGREALGVGRPTYLGKLFTDYVCSSLSAAPLVVKWSLFTWDLVLNDPLPAGVLGGVESGIGRGQQFARGRGMIGRTRDAGR